MGICSLIDNKLSKYQNQQIHQIQNYQNEKITNIKLETERKKYYKKWKKNYKLKYRPSIYMEKKRKIQ